MDLDDHENTLSSKGSKEFLGQNVVYTYLVNVDDIVICERCHIVRLMCNMVNGCNGKMLIFANVTKLLCIQQFLNIIVYDMFIELIS